MPLNINTIRHLTDLLRCHEYSEAHVLVQKLGYKKDSMENALEMSERARIQVAIFAEQLAASLTAPVLADIAIQIVSLIDTLHAQVATATDAAEHTLAEAASTQSAEAHVHFIGAVNDAVVCSLEPTLDTFIKYEEHAGADAIPLLFAVFSRQNDYYGAGSMGGA
jgi:hypothetical protein